jgi:hypothetical protein
MAKLKLAAPWYTFYNELCALFKQDKEVHIVYDEMDQIINIYVDNQAKADAMEEVLPNVMNFGSVELEIYIVPANKLSARKSKGSLFEDLFYGNSICNEVVTIEGIFTNPITYVIFKKEVVQYYNDDLGDAHGVCSTLYQDIAKRIFKDRESVYFCTDVTSSVIVNNSITCQPYSICTNELQF